MDRKYLPTFQSNAGALYAHIGRYAREMVIIAAEELGGIPALVDWARANKTEFYTKLLPKVITKEVEHTASEGIEEVLRRARDIIDITPEKLE